MQAMAQHSKLRSAVDLKDLAGAGQPILEAQVVDSADSLAYDTHDVDDAIGVGLITPEEVSQVEFWQRAVEQVRQKHPKIGSLQFVPTVIRSLISWQVTDLLEYTRHRLQEQSIKALADVSSRRDLIVGPGPQVREWKAQLETFLHERVYSHHRVLRMAAKGMRIIRRLFDEFRNSPRQLPERYRSRADSGALERTICDYLAGM